jgi:hypothetical protein
MATKVKDLNANKLFKIAKLNLTSKAKEWFKKSNSTPIDWIELRTWIM